jgi:hypothetical protein
VQRKSALAWILSVGMAVLVGARLICADLPAGQDRHPLEAPFALAGVGGLHHYSGAVTRAS